MSEQVIHANKPVSPPVVRHRHTPSPAGGPTQPIYEDVVTLSSSNRFEGRDTYLHEDSRDGLRFSAVNDQGESINAKRLAFAKQIFVHLKRQGFLGSQMVFDINDWGAWNPFDPRVAVGNLILETIGDEDRDGYFDFSPTELAARLNIPSKKREAFLLSFNQVFNPYFKEAVGNPDWLKYVAVHGEPWREESLSRLNSQLAARAELGGGAPASVYDEYKDTREAKALLDRVGFYQGGRNPYDVEAVEVFFAARYGGKMGERGEEFVQVVNAYFRAYFTASLDGNGMPRYIQDDVDLSTGILKELSRDSFGRVRADCYLYAQMHQHIDSAVGFDTQYFATYVHLGKGSGAGHAQAVGTMQADGKPLYVVSNLGRVTLIRQPYTEANVQKTAIDMLLRDHTIGRTADILYTDLSTFPIPNIQRKLDKLEFLVFLKHGVEAAVAIYGREAMYDVSFDQFYARAQKTIRQKVAQDASGDLRRQVMALGEPEVVRRNLTTTAERAAVVNNLFASALASAATLESSDYPLKVTITAGAKEGVLVIESLDDLKQYLERFNFAADIGQDANRLLTELNRRFPSATTPRIPS